MSALIPLVPTTTTSTAGTKSNIANAGSKECLNSQQLVTLLSAVADEGRGGGKQPALQQQQQHMKSQSAVSTVSTEAEFQDALSFGGGVAGGGVMTLGLGTPSMATSSTGVTPRLMLQPDLPPTPDSSRMSLQLTQQQQQQMFDPALALREHPEISTSAALGPRTPPVCLLLSLFSLSSHA